MKYTVGVDIGTFETKAVLVNEVGEVEAQAHKPHKMLVPQPGWAEHRPNEDWWGDFCEVTNKILKMSGVKPQDIVDKFHQINTDALLKLGCSWEPRVDSRGADYGGALFNRTSDERHKKIVQDNFFCFFLF